MNGQSLKFKLRLLAENYFMNKCSLVLTSETWFNKED